MSAAAAPTASPDGVASSLEPIDLFGLGLRLPPGMSLRLDQPCVHEHGSLGAWRRVDGFELACTLLWRPLAYWAREDAPAQAAALAPDELQGRFVEHALARTRRDGLGVEVLERRSGRASGGHRADLLDISIGVRRRMTRLRLRRRQTLWTCARSGRHLAFEVSARWEDRTRIDDPFTAMAATLHCHAEATP